MDDFDTSKFLLNNGMTNVLLVQTCISLEETLLEATSIPLFASIDIQPMHSVSIPSLVLFEGNKRLKHQRCNLFQFVALPSIDHILKMESFNFIDCTILKSMKVSEPNYGVVFKVISLGSISKSQSWTSWLIFAKVFGTCALLLLEILQISGFFASIYTSSCKTVCLHT